MSFLKFESDLFLEKQELNRFLRFLDNDGFRKHIVQGSVGYGFVYNENLDEDFINARANLGTNPQTVKLNPVVSVDKDGQFAFRELQDNISIPSADGRWWWLRIRHDYNSEEEGLVSISADGTLTGVGTRFTEVLRGQRNFQSKIKFRDGSVNDREYAVVDVIDDENVVLAGQFIAESNIRYSVVGTFTEGQPVSEQQKFPFQYDFSLLEWQEELTFEEPPTSTPDREFWIARVSIQSGQTVIQDKRSLNIWRTKASYNDWKLDLVDNPLIGVEQIRFDDAFSTREKNNVYVGWGFRSTNWSIDPSLNRLTLSGGQGGVYDDVSAIKDGDFDGWRVYVSAQNKYSKVINTTISGGTQVNLELDTLDPLVFKNLNHQVVVVPDVENIDIVATNQSNQDFIDQARINRVFSFPINLGYAILDLLVFADPSCLYNIKHRYKNHFSYSQWKILQDGEYLTEISFNDDGTLKPVGEQVRYTYEADRENGYIQLALASDSYNRTIQRSIFGSETFDISTAVERPAGANDFIVGVNSKNVFIRGTRSLSQDIVLNLVIDDVEIEDGSEFVFYLLANITPNGNELTINFDFENPTVNEGQVIYRFTETDLDYVKWERGIGLDENNKVVIRCVYDKENNVWLSAVEEADNAKLGDIKTVTDVSQYGGANGLGNNDDSLRWALCNGQNGTPDLTGRFIAGYGTSDGDYSAIGNNGGSKGVTLTTQQIPNHTHEVGLEDTGEGSGGVEQKVEDFNTNTNVVEKTTSGITGHDGTTQAHENRPPYYVLAFVQRIRKT